MISTVNGKCPFCSGGHTGVMCPKVKTVEFYEDGSVKRVDFKDAGKGFQSIKEWKESDTRDLLE